MNNKNKIKMKKIYKQNKKEKFNKINKLIMNKIIKNFPQMKKK